MLGHSHALSGAVAGAAAGIVLHLPDPRLAALAGFTAGMALLPDLDKCGSSPARCLGFLSETIAWITGRLTGGHRHATHSVLGIAAFTGLAWVSCHYRAHWAGKAGLALLMTLSVAAALEALHIARGHVADLIGIAVAAAEVRYGYGLTLIPLATAIGCTAHVVGDMLTDSGCMLAFPLSRHRFPPPAGAAGVHDRDQPGDPARRPGADGGAAGPGRLGDRPGLRHGALALV